MIVLKMVFLTIVGILTFAGFSFAHPLIDSMQPDNSSDPLIDSMQPDNSSDPLIDSMQPDNSTECDTVEFSRMRSQLSQSQSQLEEVTKNYTELQADMSELSQAFGCGFPPSPQPRGSFNLTGIRVGEQVSYTCPDGYSLEGAEVLKCGETRSWGQGPCCRNEITNHTLLDVLYWSFLDMTNREVRERLDKLPSFVGSLDLGYNQLSHIPILTNNTMLDTIYEIGLTNNRISKFLWDEIPTSATEVFLGENQLTQLPMVDKSHRCLKLRKLHVDHNQIQVLHADMLPTTVTELYIDTNPLTVVGDLSNTALKAIDLRQNHLTTVNAEYLPVSLEAMGVSVDQISDVSGFVNVQKVVGYCDKFREILQNENIKCCYYSLYFCFDSFG